MTDQETEELTAVLQDVVTLCETGQFQPLIFLDFIRDGKTRNLMQYHRDYLKNSGSLTNLEAKLS